VSFVASRAGPALPGPYLSWKDLPRDIKLLAVGFALVVLAGFGWLFTPWKPQPIHPLLGWSAPAPSPGPIVKPTPTPKPKAKRKPPRAPSPSPGAKKSFWPW
jgi:hypothetical protein